MPRGSGDALPRQRDAVFRELRVKEKKHTLDGATVA